VIDNTIDNTIDPNETRDYAFDWASQLALLAPGETITDAAVTIVDSAGTTATNATVANKSVAGTVVTVRLSGASGVEVYALCRVTTSTGQILDDTWRLRVTSH
jgi:hypothetical protein